MLAGAANMPQSQALAQPMSKTALHGQEISMNISGLGSCQAEWQLVLFTLGKHREAETSKGWREQFPRRSACYTTRRLIGAFPLV